MNFENRTPHRTAPQIILKNRAPHRTAPQALPKIAHRTAPQPKFTAPHRTAPQFAPHREHPCQGYFRIFSRSSTKLECTIRNYTNQNYIRRDETSSDYQY